jgi:hypothetical protein
MYGIFDISGSNKQMSASNIFGTVNNMRPIISMIVLTMVLASKLIVSEVGGNVVELELRLGLH